LGSQVFTQRKHDLGQRQYQRCYRSWKKKPYFPKHNPQIVKWRRRLELNQRVRSDAEIFACTGKKWRQRARKEGFNTSANAFRSARDGPSDVIISTSANSTTRYFRPSHRSKAATSSLISSGLPSTAYPMAIHTISPASRCWYAQASPYPTGAQSRLWSELTRR
jgi:hypothetical protein